MVKNFILIIYSITKYLIENPIKGGTPPIDNIVIHNNILLDNISENTIWLTKLTFIVLIITNSISNKIEYTAIYSIHIKFNLITDKIIPILKIEE